MGDTTKLMSLNEVLLRREYDALKAENAKLRERCERLEHLRTRIIQHIDNYGELTHADPLFVDILHLSEKEPK